MNAAEQLIYILRLAVISVSAILLVVILGLTQLQVGPTTHYHIDTHLSQVVHNAEFFTQPGVVDTDLFTQENLPEYRDAQTAFFADLTLQTPDTNTTITLHEQTADRLRALAEIQGVHHETYILPVSTTQNAPASLHIEVYYELR